MILNNIAVYNSIAPFSNNRNNLLCEIFYHYSYLWHVIAHFGKILFMRPYVTKWRRRFVCPSVNRSVYTLTFKRSDLKLRNLVQRYRGTRNRNQYIPKISEKVKRHRHLLNDFWEKFIDNEFTHKFIFLEIVKSCSWHSKACKSIKNWKSKICMIPMLSSIYTEESK